MWARVFCSKKFSRNEHLKKLSLKNCSGTPLACLLKWCRTTFTVLTCIFPTNSYVLFDPADLLFLSFNVYLSQKLACSLTVWWHACSFIVSTSTPPPFQLACSNPFPGMPLFSHLACILFPTWHAHLLSHGHVILCPHDMLAVACPISNLDAILSSTSAHLTKIEC
jgi:hypothetical protein